MNKSRVGAVSNFMSNRAVLTFEFVLVMTFATKEISDFTVVLKLRQLGISTPRTVHIVFGPRLGKNASRLRATVKSVGKGSVKIQIQAVRLLDFHAFYAGSQSAMRQKNPRRSGD